MNTLFDPRNFPLRYLNNYLFFAYVMFTVPDNIAGLFKLTDMNLSY